MYVPLIVYRVARTRSKCILTRQPALIGALAGRFVPCRRSSSKRTFRQGGRVISLKTRPSSSRNQSGWEVRHTESLHPLRFTTEKAGAGKFQPRLFNFISRRLSRAEIFHIVKQHLLAFLKSNLNLIRRKRSLDSAQPELRVIDDIACREVVVHVVRLHRPVRINAESCRFFTSS